MPPPNTEEGRWFAAEVQPHEAALRAWLRARFPSLPDHDDLVQDSFLRVLRAHAGTPIANAKGFLFSTARNLALNSLRHRRYSHPRDMGEIDPTVVLDEKADTPEIVARTQELNLLHLALESLPERCREVFVLRRLHGFSQKEIATRLGISEKTVENQCVLALRRCAEFFRRNETLPPRAESPHSHA